MSWTYQQLNEFQFIWRNLRAKLLNESQSWGKNKKLSPFLKFNVLYCFTNVPKVVLSQVCLQFLKALLYFQNCVSLEIYVKLSININSFNQECFVSRLITYHQFLSIFATCISACLSLDNGLVLHLNKLKKSSSLGNALRHV